MARAEQKQKNKAKNNTPKEPGVSKQMRKKRGRGKARPRTGAWVMGWCWGKTWSTPDQPS